MGDLIAPSGKGSSVSSESEDRDFSHANDGGIGSPDILMRPSKPITDDIRLR